jgi:hypothetical protein
LTCEVFLVSPTAFDPSTSDWARVPRVVGDNRRGGELTGHGGGASWAGFIAV